MTIIQPDLWGKGRAKVLPLLLFFFPLRRQCRGFPFRGWKTSQLVEQGGPLYRWAIPSSEFFQKIYADFFKRINLVRTKLILLE